MPYGTYTTEGFVIRTKPFGENNTLVSIFTKNFGNILASAQNPRSFKSKLRSHLVESSFGDFTLVKGKSFWKIVSARSERIFFYHFGSDSIKKDIALKTTSLLRSLLHGEEPNVELFELIKTYFSFLENIEFNADQLEILEAVFALKVLTLLGYAKENTFSFISNNSFSLDEVEAAIKHKKKLISEVNRSFKAAL